MGSAGLTAFVVAVVAAVGLIAVASAHRRGGWGLGPALLTVLVAVGAAWAIDTVSTAPVSWAPVVVVLMIAVIAPFVREKAGRSRVTT